ncbi:MAG TPA: TetR family transcriptional regulator, partial [Bryobacteraceae bacterium]
MNDRQDTKTRILDVAERLFGANGFDSTSLRDITAEAQVNLAAVNYHFQSKDSLIDAVIARRIEPVNRKRMEMLDKAGQNPTLEQILASHENTNAVVWNQEFAGLVVLEDLLVLEGLGRQGARLSGAGVTRTG